MNKSFGFYQNMFGRERLSHAGNIVKVTSREQAAQIKNALNASITRFGTWDDALKIDGDSIAVNSKLSSVDADYVTDFEYVSIETIDEDVKN
jgi:hypothetical protein